MSLSSLLIIFSSSFMALFPVINPLGNGFVVNGFFANLDPSQRKTAIRNCRSLQSIDKIIALILSLQNIWGKIKVSLFGQSVIFQTLKGL